MLNRLKVGTFYKGIYNLDKKEFEEKLEEQEEPDQTKYEVDMEQENEDFDDEEDELVMGDNLMEDELEFNEDEKRMLEMAEADDNADLDDIENLAAKIGKKRKPVKIGLEDELELEYEREDLQKGSAIKQKKK